MMQSGEVICDIPSFGFILFNLATKGIYLGKYFLDKQTDKLNKKCITGKCSELTLTNNEVKDIIKVISFLGNRGILFEETTRIITNQIGGFFNFIRPLISTGLHYYLNAFCYH